MTSDVERITLAPDQVLCVAGEEANELYKIESGKLLVCVTKGTQVSPIAYLGPGEFLGEIAFFDRQARSAHVISVEETTLLNIPLNVVSKYFPRWLVSIAVNITKKIRNADELIMEKGIRRKGKGTIDALSIDEQRHYYQLIQDHKK